MRKYRGRFLEETLWGFLTELNNPPFTSAELEEFKKGPVFQSHASGTRRGPRRVSSAST